LTHIADASQRNSKKKQNQWNGRGTPFTQYKKYVVGGFKTKMTNT